MKHSQGYQYLKKIKGNDGFIAALDQSGGSTPKALRLYGVGESDYSNDREMFDKIHEMRSRIVTSPSFSGDRILGAILFEKTMNLEISGKGSAQYLWQEKQVVPFLKVDKGLEDENNGVQLMKPIPGLQELLRQAIKKEEGILSFWKGNGVNVIRVAPYAAAQLTSNDFYKSKLQDENGKLGVKERLLAGAMAGMTGTALTHPLDTIRLRLALPNHPYKGMVNAFSVVYRTEGVRALYKGLIPTLAGIAPYAACNFASYDVAKKMYYGDGANIKQDPMANLVIGGASGTFSATVCYPLDTIRRRMQMKGKTYNGMADAMTTIMRDEGARGFFRGWTANTMKVVPQNSIRFVAYELLKTLLGCEQTKI